MKAIISHDIDHITVWEHLTRDLIVPKFIVRAKIELLQGKISAAEYFARFGDLFRNKWQCIDELIGHNRQMGIPSYFFVGVKNGLGLSYSLDKAAFWIQRIREKGCGVGVHGIAFESLETIKGEYDLFSRVNGSAPAGMRMHYVRKNEHTLLNLAKAGYRFDSTMHEFRDPYLIGNMWEFPFQVMDGWVMEKGKPWQTQNLQQAKDNTLALIDRAHRENLSYIGIDFHDRYFCKAFRTWMEWYIWLTAYLKQNGIAFTSFDAAVTELEARKPVLQPA